jgi:adenylosuccinate lyase
MVEPIPNVLAGRYASEPMVELFSARNRIVLERRLWIAVLTAQRDLGVEVPDGVIEAYDAVVDDVDLASIERRERVTRHDVKARIEEFCALAWSRRCVAWARSRSSTGTWRWRGAATTSRPR